MIKYDKTIIENYIKAVINFDYKDDYLKSLRNIDVKIILTGSFVLKYHYEVLDRNISDIDVVVLVPDVYDLEHLIFKYDEIIGMFNVRRLDYSNDNLAVIRTFLNSKKIDFFIRKSIENQTYTNNIMSIESIFEAKWKMNPFKAFKDELEMEEIKKRPKIDLPF